MFNLKDESVHKSLQVFTFKSRKESLDFKYKLKNLWQTDETINISIDRDCFIYFMKNYLGLSWRGEEVKVKQRPPKQEFFEAVVILCAVLCVIGKHSQSDAFSVLKAHFDIHEANLPDAAQVFSSAISSPKPTVETAQKLYALFDGKSEPLEHIVLGLFRLAATKGPVSAREEQFIRTICETFNFSTTTIENFFVTFGKRRDSRQGSQRTYASQTRRIEALLILGLSDGASHEQVKAAYRDSVRAHHPDMLHAQGKSHDAIKIAEEKLKAINVAYEFLMSYQASQNTGT